MAPKKGRGRRGAARPLNESQTSLLKKMVGVSVLCSLSAGALWLVARRAPDRHGAAPPGDEEARRNHPGEVYHAGGASHRRIPAPLHRRDNSTSETTYVGNSQSAQDF